MSLVVFLGQDVKHVPLDGQRRGDECGIRIENAVEIIPRSAIEQITTSVFFVENCDVAGQSFAAILETDVEGRHLLLVDELGAVSRGIVVANDGRFARLVGIHAVRAVEVDGTPFGAGIRRRGRDEEAEEQQRQHRVHQFSSIEGMNAKSDPAVPPRAGVCL